MKRIVIFAFLVFLFSPSITFAVTGEDLIPAWTDPAKSTAFQFTDNIILNGTWKLPPNWAGFIEVYGDAVVDTATQVPLTVGTLLMNIDTGKTAYVINGGATSSATTTGTFSINIGTQPNGDHNMYIKFWGGTECAVNRALNELAVNGITTRTPECGKNSDNFAPGIVWPARDYSVALPDWPRMVITPSSTPAMDFLNTTLGSQPARVFTIANTGNQTLTGSLTLVPPFTCSPCSYNINPGGSNTVTVTFAPTTSPTTFVKPADFSCIGSTKGCDGAPYNGGTPTIRTLQVRGNSVDNAMPPVLSVNPYPTINYGTVNLGTSIADKSVIVKNIGGGILNGTLTFSPALEYSCSFNPTCSYSLFAGESTTLYIHYVPVVVGPHTDTGSFSGGAGGSVSILSYVNDLPVVAMNNGGSDALTTTVDFGRVNVGQPCPSRIVYFRNSGAGVLSGSVTGVPIDVGGTLEIPGFSCISASCSSYAGMVNTGGWGFGYSSARFQFCPASAGSVDAWTTFTNSLNTMASGTVYLTGNGNVLPIGNASSLLLSFPGTLINTTITRTITISNSGVGILSGTISPATIYPTVYKCENTGVYGDTSCNFNVPAGASTVVTFSFTPTAVQNYNGDTMNIPGVGTLGFNGAGIEPKFQMSYVGFPGGPTPPSSVLPPSPKSYNVGTTTYGGDLAIQNKKFYLFVKNTGSGANANYTFHGTPHFVCISGATCSGSLAPNVGVVVTFEFQPSSPGSFPESITVDYNYGGPPLTPLQLDVTGGSVSAPYLSVSPNTNINLGNIAVGASTTADFTVTNLGVGPMSGTVTFPGFIATDPVSGLINRWTFDSADTNWTTHGVTDVAGGGNTALISGPISAVGKYGQALNFLGQGGAQTVTNTLSTATGNLLHTTSMWLKPLGLPLSRAWVAVLGQTTTGSEDWYQWSSVNVDFGVWGGGKVQPSIPVGQWSHVALVHDGATLRCYVNGVLTQSVPATYNFTNTRLYLSMGRPIYNESDFNGLIDDVRVYNRALSLSEIKSVASNTPPVTSGLKAHWTFDEPTVVWNQMKALDVTGNGNDLFLTSVPTVVPGKLAQALHFNGTYDNEVTTSNWVNNPQHFSIGAWFKTTSASGYKIVGFENTKREVTTSYDRHIYMGTDGKAHFGVYNGAVQIIDSQSALNDGVWHHVLGTHSSSNVMEFYVDGVLQGTKNVSAQVYGGYWRIGGYRLVNWTNGGDGFFNGDIDDVRIYNRPLTATEASDLYSFGISSGPATFTCISGCTFGPLTNGQASPVKIRFAPSEAIGYVGYPLFTSNGGNIGYPAIPYPSLSGNGVLNPLIDVTPPSINFPLTNLGLSSRQNIVITNTGLGDLIGNVSPVKSPSIVFYCQSNCNFNLAPGASTTAVIEFSPNATSTVASSISVTSNAINDPLVLITVFGSGKFAPIIDPRGGDTNYGKVVIGKHKSQTFTIDNSLSTADLGSGTFVVTGPYKCTASAQGFDVSGDCKYTLNAGDIATITIEFSPIFVGGLPGTSINTGSVWLSGVPLARFFVQGIGVAPTIHYIEN